MQLLPTAAAPPWLFLAVHNDDALAIACCAALWYAVLTLQPHLGQVPVEDGCIWLDAISNHGVNHAAGNGNAASDTGTHAALGRGL